MTDLYVFVHLSPSERPLIARVHPSTLSTYNGLFSLSCLHLFFPPLLCFAPLPWMLNHGPCLLGACKHASHTIGQGGGVTLWWLAKGKGPWMVNEEGVGGYHSPTGWLHSIITYPHTHTHTHPPSGHDEDPHRLTKHKHTQTHDTPSNIKHNKGFLEVQPLKDGNIWGLKPVMLW